MIRMFRMIMLMKTFWNGEPQDQRDQSRGNWTDDSGHSIALGQWDEYISYDNDEDDHGDHDLMMMLACQHIPIEEGWESIIHSNND